MNIDENLSKENNQLVSASSDGNVSPNNNQALGLFIAYVKYMLHFLSICYACFAFSSTKT